MYVYLYRQVQQVVRALSVFVPGQHKERHQIIDWFDSARLTQAQIGSIKLVGVNKENMDSSIHVDSSCVLDIDSKKGSLCSSPVYVEGQWINQLLDRMTLFTVSGYFCIDKISISLTHALYTSQMSRI